MYLRDDFLPLATVVKVKDFPHPIMIVKRALWLKNKFGLGKKQFDYGGCAFPEGVEQDRLLFFNEKDIEKVIFYGYDDDANKRFLKKQSQDAKKINDKSNVILQKLRRLF